MSAKRKPDGKKAAAQAAAEAAESTDEQVAEPEVVEAEVIEAQDEEAAKEAGTEESATADEAAADTVQAELEAAKAEALDLRDRYARLQAEWDNYRKRTANERDSERARASEKLVCDLLPVLDDLERALAHAKESGEGGSLTGGVEAVQGKFLQILGKHKVTQIEAEGEPFDAMKHQAVGTAENADVPEETVVQVYQQGYQMGDRVIRPTMVVTSVGGPARPKAEAEE